jgi:hypothetical protein
MKDFDSFKDQHDQWWLDHDKLMETAAYLKVDMDVDDLYYFFEKPWKWTPEHELMKAEKAKNDNSD